MCDLSRRSNPFDSQSKIVKRTIGIARGILYRAYDQSGSRRKADRFRDHFGGVPKPFFKIRRHG
jgi:hypothetical protein